MRYETPSHAPLPRSSARCSTAKMEEEDSRGPRSSGDVRGTLPRGTSSLRRVIEGISLDSQRSDHGPCILFSSTEFHGSPRLQVPISQRGNPWRLDASDERNDFSPSTRLSTSRLPRFNDGITCRGRTSALSAPPSAIGSIKF